MLIADRLYAYDARHGRKAPDALCGCSRSWPSSSQALPHSHFRRACGSRARPRRSARGCGASRGCGGSPPRRVARRDFRCGSRGRRQPWRVRRRRPARWGMCPSSPRQPSSRRRATRAPPACAASWRGRRASLRSGCASRLEAVWRMAPICRAASATPKPGPMR